MRHFGMWGGALAVWLLVGACGPEPVPCGESCPDISGDYGLDLLTASGVCSFAPYTLLPSVHVEQSGGEVSASALDPVSQLPIELRGEVYEPRAEDPEGTLASFSSFMRIARMASLEDPTMINLRVIMSAAVTDSEGRRTLSGTLSTASDGTGTCSIDLFFTAQRSGP